MHSIMVRTLVFTATVLFASRWNLVDGTLQPCVETTPSSPDPNRQPFCNEIRLRERGDTVSRPCRREIRQLSAAEIGAMVDALLEEDIVAKIRPCKHYAASEPRLSCRPSTLFDSKLAEAGISELFPYWDYRLDLANSTAEDPIAGRPLGDFLLSALGSTERVQLNSSRKIMDALFPFLHLQELALCVRQCRCRDAIRALSSDLTASHDLAIKPQRVLQMALAVSIAEHFEHYERYDTVFDRTQCEAAGRWLRWDESTGQCWARLTPEKDDNNDAQTTTTTTTTEATTKESPAEFSEPDENAVALNVTDSEPRGDFIDTSMKYGSAASVTATVRTLPGDQRGSDTIPERTNNLTSIELDTVIPSTTPVTVLTNERPDDNEKAYDYGFEPNDFIVPLELMVLPRGSPVSLLSPGNNTDTVLPDLSDSFGSTNLTGEITTTTTTAADEDPEGPVYRPTTTTTVPITTTTTEASKTTPTTTTTTKQTTTAMTIERSKMTTTTTTRLDPETTTATVLSSRHRAHRKNKKKRGHNNKKSRKHNKEKKFSVAWSPNTTTTVATTTVVTTTVAPDSAELSYWRDRSRKKSAYYKFDRKTLARRPAPHLGTPPGSMGPKESHGDGPEVETAMSADKFYGHYVFDSKYNFPEEKLALPKMSPAELLKPMGPSTVYGSDGYDSNSNPDTIAMPEPTGISTADYGSSSYGTNSAKLELPPSLVLYGSENNRNRNAIGTTDEDPSREPSNNLDDLLKYLAKPKLPKGAIRWRSRSAPIPMAYFTITVVEGPLTRQRRPPAGAASRRVAGAQIYAAGLNMPTGYTQITEGHQLKGSSAALVRTLSPRSSGPFVEFKVRVVNKFGTFCRQLCLDGAQRYRRCARKALRLSTYRRFSDPIPFYQSAMDALDGQWTGRGYYRRRKPDYLLFRCD